MSKNIPHGSLSLRRRVTCSLYYVFTLFNQSQHVALRPNVRQWSHQESKCGSHNGYFSEVYK